MTHNKPKAFCKQRLKCKSKAEAAATTTTTTAIPTTTTAVITTTTASTYRNRVRPKTKFRKKLKEILFERIPNALYINKTKTFVKNYIYFII